MAEKWYLRASAGVACGPGTRRALSQTADGGMASSIAIIVGADAATWNRVETTRRIAAGTWSITASVLANNAGRSLTIEMDRRTSDCTIVETFFDVTQALTIGTAVYTISQSVSFLDFDAGDILTVRFSSSHADTSVRVNYNFTGTVNDAFLSNPDTKPALSGRPKIVASEVYMPGFRAAENAILKGSDNG